MKLFCLTSGEKPSRKLQRLFDDVELIQTVPENLEDRVPEIEEELQKRGSHPFDLDEFLLYTMDLKSLGEVIERKKLNSGMIDYKGDVCFGDTYIKLNHASRLPFEGDSEILIVAPHFEEDFAIVAGYAHKRIGDSVYILFVTDIPNKKGWVEKSHDVYRNVIGLSDDGYSFVGIPDMKVHENEGKLRSAIKQKLKDIKPRNVILPSDGRNFDHKNVLRIASHVAAQNSDANIILGKSVQSINFNPKIWEVLDQEHIEKLVSIYSDGKFGSREYEFQVRNLFYELPEPLSRYVSDLIFNRRQIADVGVFSYEPLRLKKGYRVANLTNIF